MWRVTSVKNGIVAIATVISITSLLWCIRIVNREQNSFLVKDTLNSPLKSYTIAIIVVVVDKLETSQYQRALDSLKCYSQIHYYDFIVADFADNPNCQQNDVNSNQTRHCVVSNYLRYYGYLLFLDADMGVVSPKRKIEEFIDNRFDVTFYDRFYNPEIVAGAYLLKNSEYALNFIRDFADYEKHLPQSFHGTDNGGLHAFILSKIFPDRQDEYQICLELYKRSRSFDDLFTYEICVRRILGIGEEFGKIRILRKGTGWARDSWLVNSLFNPERDFMLHGWKLVYLRNYTLPIKAAPTTDRAYWYDPIIGPFDFNLCRPGNTTWNIDKNLIVPIEVINNTLQKFKRQVLMEDYRLLAKIPSMLGF